MKTLLLIGFLLLLILGASVLGWLARWYKYGGRCGPGGLKDGIPNIDAEAGTVTLDESKPTVAVSKPAPVASESALAIQEKKAEISRKASEATDSARAALGTLKAGYTEGRQAGSMPDAPADDSTAARLAAVAGSVTTKVETKLSSVSETVKEKASRVAETAKSTAASVKDGFSEGKATGETPDAPADRSMAAKIGAVVGGATAAVGAGAAKATESVKDAASSASEGTKSTLASVQDGFAEGKAPGDTPDEPADGSVAAKVGAAVGGATDAVGAGAAKATESVKDAASSASEGTKSTFAAVKDGFAEGKAPGDTPDAPADGSVAAKIGAAVGGATAAVGAGAAKATESVKDAASSASESTKSTLASVQDGFAEGKAPGDTPDEPADGSVAAKIGAAVGGATAAVGAGAAKATESVKDAASSASEGTKSTFAAVKDGFAEGKATGDTPDAPADGSVAAKIGAVVGGATAAVGAGAAKASATVKDAVLGDDTASASTRDAGQSPGGASGSASDRDLTGAASAITGSTEPQGSGAKSAALYSATDAADVTGGIENTSAIGERSRELAGRAGSTLGQEDGHTTGMEDGTSGSGAIEVDIPDALSNEETEAQRLIDSGSAVSRPASALMSPHAGRSPDDLTQIKGIGKVTQGTLNDEGIFYYDQIADFGAPDIAWADKTLAFNGRVVRDRWVPQAKGLMAQGSTDGVGTTRSSFATPPAEGDGAGANAVDIPAALSNEETEAQRLIDSGSAVSRPASALMSPHAGRSPDDLTQIKGIGKATQGTLNDEGIFYYDQIADFGALDIAWADKTLAFNGRVVRDRWVPQAKGLMAQGSADGAGTGAMRSRFAALADEAESDSADGSGMDAGVIDIPDTLSDAESEAQRLIDEGGEIASPVSTLAGPQEGRAPDDLKLISGVGPKIEGTLNEKGIYYFDQIAGFGGRDLAWADQTLGFKGRVIRDRWVPQAKALAAQRSQGGIGAKAGASAQTSSSQTSGNPPLKLAEAEALRLIEQEGGYQATADRRPAMLMRDGPAGGKADDLRRIKGIGDTLQTLLNGIGIYYFRQISEMSAEDIAWVDSKLNFKGRIIRDRWMPQAEKFERGKSG